MGQKFQSRIRAEVPDHIHQSQHPPALRSAASRFLLASFRALRSACLARRSSLVSAVFLLCLASFFATFSFRAAFASTAFLAAFSSLLSLFAALLALLSSFVSPCILGSSRSSLCGVASVDSSSAESGVMVPFIVSPRIKDVYRPVYFRLPLHLATASSLPRVTDWTTPFTDVSRPFSFSSKACSHHWSLV